eukprot:TRINITY_DN19556_c0_g1_i1.p1 TRINITY_DN19556_c0_g1~~TRINITY_DN19556_c0_g1_i1.p1  ORF type:complete len:398 (+),score=104.53 TRINITY_DN19556_c0_g1_i1:693-1886(+)
MRKVSVVGGGPAGMLLAGLLGTRGVAVDVFDKLGDIREGGLDNRYLGLFLTKRGEGSVNKLGVTGWDGVATVIGGRRVVCPLTGKSLRVVDWNGDTVKVLNRSDLLRKITEKAVETGHVTVHYNTDVTPSHFAHLHATSDLVIAADGVHSPTRANLSVPHTKTPLDIGYCWAHITCNTLSFDTTRVTVWPLRHDMGFVHGTPSARGGYNVTFVMRKEALQKLEEDTEGFLSKHVTAFSKVEGIHDILKNAVKSPFHIVSCDSYLAPCKKGIIIGDAAHAIPPYLGQGLNISLEDAATLAETLLVPDASLAEFLQQRKKEAESCLSLTLEQERYLFSVIKDPLTVYRTRYHNYMRKVLPSWYSPSVREMVNNPMMRYSQVLEIVRRQNGPLCIGRVYE